MQTFLAYDCFGMSARVLDNKRLGKQRVEVLQILHALKGQSKGWQNHPATRMWRGHELRLCTYGMIVCQEWIGRGFKDTCREKILKIAESCPFTRDSWTPEWLGDDDFHASHRSNLLRKDPEWYSQFNWTEGPDYAYVWPV